MKKILTLMLVFAMLITLVACGGNETSSDIISSDNESTENVTSVEETVSEKDESKTEVSSENSSKENNSKDESSSKKQETSSKNTSSKKPSNVTSVYQPTYTPTDPDEEEDLFNYIEDSTISSSTWKFDTLKTKLQSFADAGKLNISDQYKDYGLLGYYVQDSTMKAEISVDGSNKVNSYKTSITAPYKDTAFVQDAIKRDVEKLTTFAGEGVNSVMLVNPNGGNPQHYTGIDQLPATDVDKICKGNSSLQIRVNFGKDENVSMLIGCERKYSTLMFTTSITVNYE